MNPTPADPTPAAPALTGPDPGRRRLRWLVALVGLVAVAVVAGLALASQSEDSGAHRADVTDPARFDLPAVDGGGRIRLADFKGRPLVVNFFASWCGPCKRELPDFAAAARALSGKVRFVAFNSQEISEPEGVELARATGLFDSGVRVGRDVGGRAGSLLHDALGRGMPVTAFYDSAGKLLDVAQGQLTRDKLAAQLQRLFGVPLAPS